MEGTIVSQLVTAGSTLAGVVLTLAVNALLERGKARDARWLEGERLKAQHVVWLRDERRKAYSAMSSAGEDIMQFIQNDLVPMVASMHTGSDHEPVTSKWKMLREGVRKAYNQVLLLGGAEAREAATKMWRTARSGVNDILDELAAADAAKRNELAATATALRRELGSLGRPFMDACRKELSVQGE